jgi:hypothetical protein
MTLRQWLIAIAITLPVTEASYRYIETPIRQGRFGEWLRGERRPRTAAAYKKRQRLAGIGIASAALVGFAGVSIAMADNQCVGQIECDSAIARAIDSPLPTDAVVPTSLPTQVSAAPGPTVALAPGQTAAPEAPTTTAEPTTTVLQDKPYFAIGESVMLGAKPVLDARGITTVAEVSKSASWEIEQLQLAKRHYRFTHGIVIQLGTNGSVTRDEYEAVLAEVSDVNRVVVMTVKAPKPWIAPNNEIIRSLPETHPNVVLLDWELEANKPEWAGHLSGVDGGVHLKDDTAKQLYRDLILQALGLPT